MRLNTFCATVALAVALGTAASSALARDTQIPRLPPLPADYGQTVSVTPRFSFTPQPPVLTILHAYPPQQVWLIETQECTRSNVFIGEHGCPQTGPGTEEFVGPVRPLSLGNE